MWIKCTNQKIVNADRLTRIDFYETEERTSSYCRPVGTWSRAAFEKDYILISESNVIDRLEAALANGTIILDLTKEEN